MPSPRSECHLIVPVTEVQLNLLIVPVTEVLLNLLIVPVTEVQLNLLSPLQRSS